MGFFLERFIINSQGSNSVEVNSNWGDLDISQVERFGKFLDFSVFSEEAATVIVVVGSNTSLDVNIDIGTTVSLSEFLQHLHFSFKFSSFDF